MNKFVIRQTSEKAYPEFYINGNIIEDIISVDYKFQTGDVTQIGTGDELQTVSEDCVLTVVVKYWDGSIKVTKEFTNIYTENE